MFQNKGWCFKYQATWAADHLLVVPQIPHTSSYQLHTFCPQITIALDFVYIIKVCKCADVCTSLTNFSTKFIPSNMFVRTYFAFTKFFHCQSFPLYGTYKSSKNILPSKLSLNIIFWVYVYVSPTYVATGYINFICLECHNYICSLFEFANQLCFLCGSCDEDIQLTNKLTVY